METTKQEKVESSLLKLTTGFLAFQVATVERVLSLDKQHRVVHALGSEWLWVGLAAVCSVSALIGLTLLLLHDGERWRQQAHRAFGVVTIASLFAYSVFVTRLVQTWYAAYAPTHQSVVGHAAD